ncbi:hypothetical protein PROFUN_01778 [Planoprotostelium fungivorum]|uniref:START domain-containing protein n=1 Tax=Planoprotostelium fungivorum TaxID=1890364 RepID=A0A2P6MWG4_9EUKA|nr:hypothetical protein PROFUN_01778 [Planoprotostelium fungivorum]
MRVGISKRTLVFVAVFCQCLMFYLYLANQYRNVRHSVFWDNEEGERQKAKDRETSLLKDLQLLKDGTQKLSHLVQKREQLQRGKEEFYKIFNASYSEDSQAKTEFKKKDLCIGIVTVDRRPQRYLLETVASVIRGVDSEIADRVTIFVLNTMINEADHPDALYLSPLVPVLHRSHIPQLVPKGHEDSGWYKKETIDYVTSLNVCQKLSRYTLILEDDVLVTSHLVQKLFERALDPLERGQSTTQSGLFNEPWLFVRLFYTNYWSGWATEDIFTFPFLFFTLGSIFTLIVLFFLWPSGRDFVGFVKAERKMAFILWMSLSLFSAVCLYSVGKQNIMSNFRTGLWPFGSHAFTVGMVFSNDRMEGMSRYLLENYQEVPVDILIGRYAGQEHLRMLLLVPNLVQHIGAYSSNRDKVQGFRHFLDDSYFEYLSERFEMAEIPNTWHIATQEEYDEFVRAIDSPDKWTQCFKNADSSIQVWYQKSDVSPINEVKIQAVWKQINPEDLYDVLHDSKYRGVWDKNMIDNDLIEQLDNKNDIGYYSAKCPVGIANRDFCNIRSWSDIPDGYVIMNHSVQHPKAPLKKSFVRPVDLTSFRANSIKTGYVIRRREEGCVITYVTTTDPKGSIPVMIFNKMTQKLAPKILDRLSKAVLDYPAWKSQNQPEHKPWR